MLFNQRYELLTLKALRDIHANPTKQIRKLRFTSIILYVSGIIFAILFAIGTKPATPDLLYGLIGGIFAGVMIGLGVYYRISSRQIPYLNKFVNINAVNARLHELQSTK